MDEYSNEKKAGFFSRLIDAVHGIFEGGSKKKSDSTAVANIKAKELSRIDLLEMLVELGKENARLKAEIEDQGREIEKKSLLLQAARKTTPVLTIGEEVNLSPSDGQNSAASYRTQMQAAESEARAIDAERRAAEAEQRARKAEAMVEAAERRAREAEEKAAHAELQIQEAQSVMENLAAAPEALEAEIPVELATAGEESEPIEAAAPATAEIAVEATAGTTETVIEELVETVEIETADTVERADANLADAAEPAEQTLTQGSVGLAEEVAKPVAEELVQEPADDETKDEDIDEDSLYSAPIPGSLEAIIAANAAAAALRSRAFSDEVLEEAPVEEELVEKLSNGDEPAAEEPAEEQPIEAETAKATPEPVATPVKEAHTRPNHRPEPLRAAKSRAGRSGRAEGRVSMREAARRAGFCKD